MNTRWPEFAVNALTVVMVLGAGILLGLGGGGTLLFLLLLGVILVSAAKIIMLLCGY